MNNATITHNQSASVEHYYGEVLQGSHDLRTSACCPLDAFPTHLRPYLAHIHEEVQNRFYGCGSPIPPALQGKTILDLGCGTGRDVYLLSQLVGESGTVIGVDMTRNQLEVAERHLAHHMRTFGYARPNVTFLHGRIENLQPLGIDDNSIDVVVSNCVINLSADKEQVFREIFRVLKPGGELFFSDVFSDRRIPPHLALDPVVLGECLGGALYTEDFRRMLVHVGCADYRTLSGHTIEIHDPEIRQKAGLIEFSSQTIRAFKGDFEDRCEQYGQVARYLGTIKESPHRFVLDDHHEFPTGMYLPVCGNTAKMLSETRYGEHFEVHGDRSHHYGLFDCAPRTKVALNAGCC